MATRLLKILFEFFYLYVLYALLHSQTGQAGGLAATMLHTALDGQEAETMSCLPLPAPRSEPLSLRATLRPCHKSKEQIAAAKAVKANKPKCRHNKLAGVMRGTLWQEGGHEGLRGGVKRWWGKMHLPNWACGSEVIIATIEIIQRVGGGSRELRF